MTEGGAGKEQMFLIGAVVICLFAVSVVIWVFVTPVYRAEVKATKLAADIAFYLGALSGLEKDERGDVEITLDGKYDVVVNRLTILDLERGNIPAGKTFARPGIYVTAYMYAGDGKEKKKGKDIFVISDNVAEMKFTASSFIRIVKESDKEVRLEYL